jgi:LytS/YehU family sensor histidine kinase
MSNKKYLQIFFGLALIISITSYLYLADITSTDYYTVGLLLSVVIFLWLGNYMITKQLDLWFPWLKYGKKRFFAHLLIGIFYSTSILNLAYFIFKTLLTTEPPTAEQFITINIFGAIFLLPIFSIYFSLQFLSHWQSSELEMEKFQKESMRSQLATLKNHLDPHFLFNNLNILSALIDKDRDMSQEFLVRFAQVYRTMLLTKVEDLITLEEEMEFIKSYIYLITTRFEDNIQFKIEIDDEAYFAMLPPLTIQMLLENAIKHNIITEKVPLIITIRNNNSRLEVTNNLNEKPEDLKTKSGTGIKNIIERLKYFTDEEMIMEKTEHEYRVSIPMMEVETI